MVKEKPRKERKVMATSSIIDNIRVNNPYFLEEYAKYLEEIENQPFHPRTEAEKSSVNDDPEAIREFMQKALARHGIQL